MATVNLRPGVNDFVSQTSSSPPDPAPAPNLLTAGADTLVIPTGTPSSDIITGFQSGTDRIDISRFGLTPVNITQQVFFNRVRISNPAFGAIDLYGLTAPLAPDTFNFITAPDLSITKTAVPSPAVQNGVLTYNLVVSNTGGTPATNITVQDILPPGFTFTSATGAAGFTSSQAGGTVTFGGGSIAPGSSTTLSITGTATSIGILSNSAVVDPNNLILETNEGNNSVAIATTVSTAPAAPDLSVSKTVSVNPALTNQSLTYSIVVSNAAAAPGATGFTITDVLPTGFTVTSVNAPGFTTTQPSPGQLGFTGGSIAGGASVTLTITGTAPGFATNLTNIATVTPATGETNFGNNSTTIQTPVNAPTFILVSPTFAGAPGTSVSIDPDLTGPQPTLSGILGVTAFAQIQPAIDAAPPGGTVFVAPGTYNEAINFVKPLTLSGPNATVDPLTGTRVTEATIGGGTEQGSIGFERSAPGNNGPILIAGFSFGSLRFPPGTLGGYGIDTQNSNGNVTIRNNIFNNNRVGVGNQIASPGFPETNNLTIEQNLFNMSSTNAALPNEPVGIALQRVQGITIRNNRFGGGTSGIRNGIFIDPPRTAGQGGGNLPAPFSSGITITGNQFFVPGVTVGSGGLDFSVSQSSNPGVFPANVDSAAPGVVTAIA